MLHESYFRDKNLLYGNVVHYPYKKSLGANYYVTKFIGSDKIEWDVIKTENNSENQQKLILIQFKNSRMIP